MKICPICGDTDIRVIPFTIAPADFCNGCGNGKQGNVIFPEIDEEDLESFRKDLKESKENSN